MPPRNPTTALVIAEQESSWSHWVERLHAVADAVFVVSQHEGESASAFAARARSSIEELASGSRIVATALVGGARHDGGALAARSSVLRALTAHMVRAGEGRLMLDGGPSRPGRLAMRALADMVAEQIQRTGVSVTSTADRAHPMAA